MTMFNVLEAAKLYLPMADPCRLAYNKQSVHTQFGREVRLPARDRECGYAIQ